MTYGEIFNEFSSKFPNLTVDDMRPATEFYVPELKGCKAISNAIIVWLKDNSRIIYISDKGGDTD